MKDTEIKLNGVWLFLLKSILGLSLVLIPIGIGWGWWVTTSISDLKSSSAVTESRNPAVVIREASIESRLATIQADIVEVKLLIAKHIAQDIK